MQETKRNSTIKIYVGDILKSKLKATASLHNMTFTEFFLDAVFAKYPHLSCRNVQVDRKEQLRGELATILVKLSNSAELSEKQRNELKDRKNLLKEKIRKLEAEEQEQAKAMSIEDFISSVMAESKVQAPSVIPLPDKINLQPHDPKR